MDNFKSEHIKEVVEKIVSKLPISSLVLVLGMMIGEYGLYKMYTESSNGMERLILLIAFVCIIVFFVVIAGIIYVRDFNIVSSYIKSTNSKVVATESIE